MTVFKRLKLLRVTGSGSRQGTRFFLCAILLGLSGCSSNESGSTSSGPPFQPEEGFTLLTMADFIAFPAAKAGDGETWSAEGSTIICTGKPRGYAYTNKSYGNFTLRLEYRFAAPDDGTKPDDSNTGFLIYISGDHKVWPVCLEVQGKHSEMAGIKSNSRDVIIEIEDNESARETARRPVGEWNRIEIVSKDGALTSILNGTQICQSVAGELQAGPLGLQSEGFAVEFRNVRIREE